MELSSGDEHPVKLSERGEHVNSDGMNEELPADRCNPPGVGWINDPGLREMQFPELQWLISDELPVGYTLIMGAPKTGKTALVLPLAHRLVRKGLRVLYIKLDDSLRRMRTRTVMANPRNDSLTDLWYVDGWRPRSSIEAFSQLALWLGDSMAKDMHFDAVIVDTYGRFIGRRPAGDVFGHDYQMGEEFKRLCETFDASVIVTHHTRKGAGNEEDWLDMMSGSAGMAAAADCIWYITRTRGGRDGLLRITGNDMEEVEKPVILGKDMVWRANDTITVAQARHSGVPRAILDFLAGEAEGSGARITAAVGAPANTVHVALQRLAAEGVIEWTRVGRDSVWSLTLHPDNRVCSGESDGGGLPTEDAVRAPAADPPSRDATAPDAPPPPSAGTDRVGEAVPVQAGSGRATGKLIEVLTASRLHPLFKLDPAVKAMMLFDRVCLGGKGNQWALWPASDPGGMVFRFDRKAAYYASHPWIAPNVLTRRGPMTWEEIKSERLAGMFEIVPTSWVHKNMPSPYGRTRPRGRELVARPTLNRLHRLAELGLMDFPKITFGMVGRGSENLLNDWLDWCLAQRRAAVAAGDQELADAVKADQNQAMGSLRIVGSYGDGTPKPPGVVDRWDWQYGMISHHYAMMHHYAIKSQMAGEPLGAVGNTDELVYFMPTGTPADWVPATLVKPIERGQFALKSAEPSGPWFEKYGRGVG